MPSRLIIGLVSSSAYIGDYKKSPFNFKTFNANYVGLFVDGQSLPSQPLQPNYDQRNYLDCFRTLTTFRNDIDINREDYTEGYCLYVLDLNPYYSFNTKRKGHCRLEVKVFWYPKLICTSHSRAFKTKHFDINLVKFGGLIRKLWVIK